MTLLRPVPAVDPEVRFVPKGALFQLCTCHDRLNEEIARLVNEEGWDQWTASYFVHTGVMPPPVPPAWDATPAEHSSWVRAHVKALFTPLARKVGLR